MAVSLKTQGFKHIVLLGDSGGNIKPLTEAAEALNAKWKAAGSDVRAYSITEDYNYGEVEEFEKTALGIHEQMEGLHDDYYISAIIAVHDPNGVRMPERVKAGKFAINGVSLAPIEETVENGKRSSCSGLTKRSRRSRRRWSLPPRARRIRNVRSLASKTRWPRRRYRGTLHASEDSLRSRSAGRDPDHTLDVSACSGLAARSPMPESFSEPYT